MSAKSIDTTNIRRVKVFSSRLLGLHLFPISEGLYRKIMDNLLRHFEASPSHSFCKLNNFY